MQLGCRQALDSASGSLVEQQRLEMLCLTWNVNEQKPNATSTFFGVVGQLAAPEGIKLAIFGLQEIEMGSHSVAIAAAKDKINKKAQVCSLRYLCKMCTPWSIMLNVANAALALHIARDRICRENMKSGTGTIKLDVLKYCGLSHHPLEACQSSK